MLLHSTNEHATASAGATKLRAACDQSKNYYQDLLQVSSFFKLKAKPRSKPVMSWLPVSLNSDHVLPQVAVSYAVGTGFFRRDRSHRRHVIHIQKFGFMHACNEVFFVLLFLCLRRCVHQVHPSLCMKLKSHAFPRFCHTVGSSSDIGEILLTKQADGHLLLEGETQTTPATPPVDDVKKEETGDSGEVDWDDDGDDQNMDPSAESPWPAAATKCIQDLHKVRHTTACISSERI